MQTTRLEEINDLPGVRGQQKLNLKFTFRRRGQQNIIIFCYVDFVVLLAPSLEGLQILIDKVCSILPDLNLLVNMRKLWI